MIFKRSITVVVCPTDDEERDVGRYRNTYDFVRARTLGMLADEIRTRLSGEDFCIAEVGVFRGDFASRLNNEFPDKQFYLFDTFEGFPDHDKQLDIQMKLSENTVYKRGNFNATSVRLVLGKMSNPELCQICKGYFPETLGEEHKDLKWGLVSLDVDLYKPTLDALEFFYPSLLPGGYIMIHDYNNQLFRGVRQAVKEFEEKHGEVAKIPIPDSSGSLVIAKP